MADNIADGDTAEGGQTFEHRFQVDYAKSGRAKCKGCKEIIPAGMLRIATLSKSFSFDGTMTQWFHINCFFKEESKRVNYPSKPEEVKDFFDLRTDDQDKLTKLIQQFRDKGVGDAKPAKKAKTIDAASKSSSSPSKSSSKKTSANDDEKASQHSDGAFKAFSESAREQVKKKHPDYKESDIAKALSKQWQKMSDSEQQKYAKSGKSSSSKNSSSSRERSGKASK